MHRPLPESRITAPLCILTLANTLSQLVFFRASFGCAPCAWTQTTLQAFLNGLGKEYSVGELRALKQLCVCAVGGDKQGVLVAAAGSRKGSFARERVRRT